MDEKLLGVITEQTTFKEALPSKSALWQHHFQHLTVTLYDYHDSYKDIAIQYRGKLYNHEALKKKLAIKAPLSDAKLILIAYQTWGIKLLSHLDGIFSFALIDLKNALLFLAKDRVSVKPLYYYHDHQTLLFGSSLKALKQFPFFKKELDFAALSNYFTYGYIMQPNAIFQNCKKVKSGHFIRFKIDTQQIEEEKYWDLGNNYDTPKWDKSEQEFQDEAESLLLQSIQKRIQGSGVYAASLSGGYDSSTIAALLQKSTDSTIKTFTIGFEDESINEAPDAKRIAEYIGSEHIEHYFSADDALKIIPLLSEVYEEPFYDNGSIPTTLLASIAKSYKIDTIFAGDGGDEVFATADDIQRFEHILSLPQPIRNTLFSLLNKLNPSTLPYLKENKNIPTKYYKFINILKAKNISQMVQVKMTLFHPFEINQLLIKGASTYPSIFDDIYFGEYAESVDKVIGSYFKSFMTDGELIKTTQAFSYQNIAIREPYLDIDLINYMAKVPSSIKIKGGVKKNLLKNIAHKHIKKELLDRPKKGFSVPFSHWMRHDLHPLLMDTLNEENLKKDGILDPKYVINLRNSFLNGKEEYKYKLWSILLYQLWYEKNMR
jgi:asparagine synthase (glutamine-hydrolysing)